RPSARLRRGRTAGRRPRGLRRPEAEARTTTLGKTYRARITGSARACPATVVAARCSVIAVLVRQLGLELRSRLTGAPLDHVEDVGARALTGRRFEGELLRQQVAHQQR